MYKFTNGIVVFDEETRDKYIKAGMTLIKEEEKNGEAKNEPIKSEYTGKSKNIIEHTKADWE